MNTYYAKIKEILIEPDFLIKKINDYQTLLYSDNTAILEHRRVVLKTGFACTGQERIVELMRKGNERIS